MAAGCPLACRAACGDDYLLVERVDLVVLNVGIAKAVEGQQLTVGALHYATGWAAYWREPRAAFLLVGRGCSAAELELVTFPDPSIVISRMDAIAFPSASTAGRSGGSSSSEVPQAGLEDLLAGALEQVSAVRQAPGPYTRQLVSRLFVVTHPQVMAAWRRMDPATQQVMNHALWLVTRVDWFTARQDDIVGELASWYRGSSKTPQLHELWAELAANSSDFFHSRHLPGPLPPATAAASMPLARAFAVQGHHVLWATGGDSRGW